FIAAAWNSAVAVEINTDAYGFFSDWQLKYFGSFARPMYVRLDPDGTVERWNEYFSPSDEETVQLLIDFLRADGGGLYTGSGENWLEFILFALAGGLFTLLMPCTYPMLPLTINFFNKQSDAGHKLMPLAFAYAFGIMASFTLLGVIVGIVFGQSISGFAGNPWVNLVIAVVFIVLGLSLLGVFFLRLPASLTAGLGGGRAGYIGALLMGLTFAITAFTCTAPFAGAVLAEGIQNNDIVRPALGMLLYSSVIAVPFFFLSLSPNLMKKMPQAGSWMNEIKVIGGVIEIAAALKFLAISDNAWSWGIFARTFCLSAWIIGGVFCALYLVGLIRFKSDTAAKATHPLRLVLSLSFLALAGCMLCGLIGFWHLGIVEAWFPADAAPIIK
ncbi:MAG: hypothetical protein HRU15_19755, partial [Planctomycetes bacterium]|nr:hypothetical protein [Planctomycetota bacterium]